MPLVYTFVYFFQDGALHNPSWTLRAAMIAAFFVGSVILPATIPKPVSADAIHQAIRSAKGVEVRSLMATVSSIRRCNCLHIVLALV